MLHKHNWTEKMLYTIFLSFYRWCRNQKRRFWDPWTRRPPIGAIDFGDLRRLQPVSKDFGFDRGMPVDRYYIEAFLQQYRLDIRGRVLEIAAPLYTRKFGDERVTQSDVLDLDLRKPGVTIIADLTDAQHIRSDTFDCLIVTQTLQFIFEVQAALKTCYRILKPGGILLATFPGLSRLDRSTHMETWEDCWHFTVAGARKTFAEIFPVANFMVQAFGNVLAATAFLHGLAAEEFIHEELDYQDPDYEVTIAVRAQKPGSAAESPSRITAAQ
jgi:SAM-dependent methyltransferase